MPWAILDLDRQPPDERTVLGGLGEGAVPRRGRSRRDSFLTSLGAHLLVGALLILTAGRMVTAPPAPRDTAAASPVRHVFLPAPALRRLVKPMPRPERPPRDRISVGAPSVVRQREPLVLHRDDDLTRVAHGRPDVAPAPPAPAPETEP